MDIYVPLHEYNRSIPNHTYEEANKVAFAWSKGVDVGSEDCEPYYTPQYYTVECRDGVYWITNRFDPRVARGK